MGLLRKCATGAENGYSHLNPPTGWSALFIDQMGWRVLMEENY
jgi:hypothetical protein